MKPNYFMRGYCPLIEEFHIRNILGCLEKKQYIFGGIISPMLADTQTITLSSLTGGLITNVPTDPRTGFPSYLILAQKINATAVNKTFIDPVGTTSFVLNGDTGATYHLVIMATYPNQPLSKHLQTTKWAQDYCPFCRSVGFKGIVGSVLKDLACFSFKAMTAGGGTATVKFATSTDTTGMHTGMTATAVDSGAGALTIDVVAAAGTFERGAGNFLTDGFGVGQSITPSGFTNLGNNATKIISAVTTTVITVSDVTGLMDESGTGNERIIANITGLDHYYETGQKLPSMVTMMADASYQIIITKSTEGGGVITVAPYPSAIAKDGFILNGDASQEYDVLILGQIQF